MAAAVFVCSVLVSLVVPLLVMAAPATNNERRLQEAAAMVLPGGGHHSRIMLKDSMPRLVQAGILDPHQFEAIYDQRGGMATELKKVLTAPSYKPILITRANAGVYVNLLWPLGLANQMLANNASPLNGPSLFNFASTSGWYLGRSPNGGDYFNKFEIVKLSPQQEALVVQLARAIYRPCCDNSTFFQDCNHGSALLGLLALGAAQGLGEKELYREALAFNAFWFPGQYAQTALFFKVAKGLEWGQIDARLLMSAAYSSASGWRTNVAAELTRRGLIRTQNASACSA